MKKITLSLICLGIIFVFTDQSMAQNCKPGNNHVAVFTEPEYRGSCAVLSIGDYPEASPAKGIPSPIASIIIGSNVRVQFCDGSGPGGCQTIDKTGNVNSYVRSIKVSRNPNAKPTVDSRISPKNAGVLIAIDGGLLGGYKNGRIIDPKTAVADFRMGEEYKAYGLKLENSPSMVRATTMFYDDRCGSYGIGTGEGVALSSKADWNPIPRSPRTLDSNNKTYRDIVRRFLQSQGIPNPVANIKKIMRVDLENDGQDEVIIYAAHDETSRVNDWSTEMLIKKGSYSILMVRKIISGKVKNIMIDGQIIKTDMKSAIWGKTYDVSAILDLDDDGIMEIVVDSKVFEGYGTTVYKIKNGKSVAVLEDGCGA